MTNNQIQLFTNPAFGDVRVVMQGDEPWFVAKDVAKALGYASPSDAVYRLVEKEDKRVLMLDNLTALCIPEMLENQRFSGVSQSKTTIINESAVYCLITSSQLESAKQFKHWVTSEVLPSIRKHGIYATPATVERMLQDPDNMIKLLQTLKTEREAKEQAIRDKEQAEAQIEVDRPKVIFAEAVECSKTSILIGELAKLIRQNGVDIGQNRLFEWLRENGYLTLRNRPTQKSMDLGLIEVKEWTITNPDGSIWTTFTTKVTGKGQQYFVNKFLSF